LKSISISFRLTCWFSAVFLFGFVVFGVVMWTDLAWQLSKGRDRTLSRRATRCVELLEAASGESPERRALRFAELVDAMPEGNLVRVYNARGIAMYPEASSPADFRWPAVTFNPGDRYDTLDSGGKRYRVLTRNVDIAHQRVTLLVGGQLEDNRQLLGRFEMGLEAATPVLLILSACCGYLLSRRALQPVDRLTAAVRSISIGNLSGRLPIHATGDELQRLAETCNDMLERVESAVSRINRFTADASHELRSPISFIRNVAEYALQNRALNTETRQEFEEILVESVEAGRLLEDLLTLARADAGRLQVALEPLDLREIVLEAGEKARIIAADKHQSVAILAGNGLPVGIRGDRSSIRRLLWALLDNAIKFTPDGGRIEVGLDRTSSHARVRVRDTGMGIPEGLMPRVFERFFRVDPSRSQVNGTGLGLAIAKWIADAHHAALSVESKEGDGAVFTVLFPFDTQTKM
jgi:heavy metal sensor kinase